MKRIDLKRRYYEAVGDVMASPVWFPESRVNDLLNDGCALMRGMCGEVWKRSQEPVIAGTAEYQLPGDAVRLVRLAFKDRSLEERSRMALVGEDAQWESRTSSLISDYTQDGLPWNRYLLVPIPSVSTSGGFTFVDDPEVLDPNASSETGINISRDGFTCITDPVYPLASPNYGIIISSDTYDCATNYGLSVVAIDVQYEDILTLWYVERAAAMTDDGAEVPIARPYQLGPLYYALWKTYDEEGDHYNSILAGFYREQWNLKVARCSGHADNPLPKIVHVLGGNQSRAQGARSWPSFPNSMTDPGGTSHELIW